MKKILSLVLIISLTIKVSGCLQQAQQPTKSSILSALNTVNAYTYEFSEKRIVQNRTYNIYGVVGIDKKTLHFFLSSSKQQLESTPLSCGSILMIYMFISKLKIQKEILPEQEKLQLMRFTRT